MVSVDHKLSQRRQCALLRLARSSLYDQPVGERAETLKFMEIMEIMDKPFLKTPWYGFRPPLGQCFAKACRAMDGAFHAAPRPQLRSPPHAPSDAQDALFADLPGAEHEQKGPASQGLVLPAEKGLVTDRPNQVWCADITYIPMRRGFRYLVAIMDCYSRKVQSWRLSNSREAEFCVEALKVALDRYCPPHITNIDQRSPFTGVAWTSTLTDAEIKISMDGRGRWIDNRMIEHLWRSLKYACVYLNAFETGSEARGGIGKWRAYDNAKRPHSTHSPLTPDEA